MASGSKAKREDFMLNGRQCAQSIGITINAFKKWNVPHEKVGGENLYLLKDVLEVYRARVEREVRPRIEREVLAEQASAESDDPENLNPVVLEIQLLNERRRLTAAQAEAQEQKNRMMRHEIAPFGFITFALASMGNSLAASLDAIPTILIRQAGIKPKDAEKVRESTATVANQVASLGDKDWVATRYDEYLAEMDS